MICTSITETRLEGAIKAASSADAEMVEIRLDHIHGDDLKGLARLGEIKKPVIATCMPDWEGGRFAGEEEERIKVLEAAIPHAQYVSIELKTKKDLRDGLIEKAKRSGVKVIVASHDFEKTPRTAEIRRIIDEAREAGADIAKVAFKAQDYDDVMRLMGVLTEEKKIPLIAISMGEYGKMSRVIAPLLGAYLTFAAPEKGRESAPGQLSAGELRQITELLKPDKEERI